MISPVFTQRRFLRFIQLPVVALALSACGLMPEEQAALIERRSTLENAEITQGQRRFGDATYSGTLRGNQPDGQGTLEWDDGRRYQGTFNLGQMQGQGILTLKDGTQYKGAFQGDRPFGKGTLTLADGRVLTGTFDGLDEADGSMAMTDGSRHEGEFKDQELHGQGTRVESSGEQLSGQYRNGMAYGLMRLTAPGEAPRRQLWLKGERLMGHLADPADFGPDPQAMAREIIASHQFTAEQLPDPVIKQTLDYSAALLEDSTLDFTPQEQVAVLADWPQLAGAMSSPPYQTRLQELATDTDCSDVATAMTLFPESYTRKLQQTCAAIANKQDASAADYAYLLDNQLITGQQIPERHQPLLSGPEGARPVDLLAQLERGADANQLATLIASGSNAYPRVYGDDMRVLRDAGVPGALISAMQSANQRYVNEQEEQRRYRQEQRRIERQMAEERRREEELQRQMEREEERMRQAEFEAEYGSNQSSGVDWAEVIEYAGQAMMEVNENQQRINRENRQIAIEAQRIKNQRQIDAWEKQRQQAAERQQAIARQRQIQQQEQREREARRNRQREEQAARQREMKQRLARLQSRQQAARDRLASSQPAPNRTVTASASGNGDTAVAKNSGPQKVYEPNMLTVTGESTAGFSSRDYTVELALLNGINQLSKMCREKGARADPVPLEMRRSKTAPPRWNFGTPQCHQGGWRGEEWYCDIKVSATCYRMQSFSSP